MVKRSVLVVLTLLLTLVLSTAVLAAPPGANPLSDQIDATISVAPAAPGSDSISLSWDIDTNLSGIKVGEPRTFTVTATNQAGQDLERVLYVINITKDDQPVTPSDNLFTIRDDKQQTLGYDDDDEFWFYGPYNESTNTGGFTFPAGTTNSTTFSITFNQAGSYNVTLQAFQLPEPTP